METPEQYTVKTPYDCFIKHYNVWSNNDGTLEDAMLDAIKEYSSELIKENERLSEENKELREALTEAKDTLQWHMDKSVPFQHFDHSNFFNLTANAITQAESVLSKFQPKKDETAEI